MSDEHDDEMAGTDEQRDNARARATACSNELMEVLAKHSCFIATQVSAEPVGHGDRALVQSSWGVYPRPVQ